METIMITRHKALVQYAIEKGIVPADVRVLPHVSTPKEVAGKHVVGPIPLHLAAAATRVTHIPLSIPPELRGVELTLEQLREMAGPAETYAVMPGWAADGYGL